MITFWLVFVPCLLEAMQLAVVLAMSGIVVSLAMLMILALRGTRLVLLAG